MADSITPAWLMPIQNTKLVMKKPQATGRFRPVTPRPRFTIMPMAMAATSRISPRMVTTGQNHRGESRMDRSKSRLISRVLRTLPSCMVVPFLPDFPGFRRLSFRSS